MPDLPSGTVTFLFTDIEVSTTRLEHHPQAMRQAVARHDALLHEGFTAHGGGVNTECGEGNGLFALVVRPSDATVDFTSKGLIVPGACSPMVAVR